MVVGLRNKEYNRAVIRFSHKEVNHYYGLG